MADRGGGRGGRGGRGDRGGERGGRGRGGDKSRGDFGDSRGGRGGRGRGDSSEGGRGRGRGDFEGGRGRGRGDFEGGRGRGRGDFEGGRGRGRGDYDGGRGRGRGDYDGGRGRGRGRGRGGGGESRVFSGSGETPAPDASVQALEDRIVGQQSSVSALTAKTGQLSITSSSNSSIDAFPARPAFGSSGQPTVLWANYFTMKLTQSTAIELYRYYLEIKEVKPDVAKVDDGPSSSQPTDSAEGSQSAKGKPRAPPPREIKGRKLYLAIEKALQDLPGHRNNSGIVFASEFKSQVVTLKRLDLGTEPLRITLQESEDRSSSFDVTFNGPNEVRVGELLDYIMKMDDAPGDHVYPRSPEVVDALNVLVGYYARAQRDQVTATPSGRFFSFVGGNRTIQDLGQSLRPLVAARGFFQSARIATGRLLVNVNVTHGVFALSGKMSEIFNRFEIWSVKDRGQDKRTWNKAKSFAKVLARTRVKVTLNMNGKQVTRYKTICGLVSPADMRRRISRKETNPPKFGKCEFAGPRDIHFYRNDANPDKSAYISVFDYFKKEYNVTLGDLPVLNLGTLDRPTFFPAEVVEIPAGQQLHVKLTGRETTNMVEFACRTPFDNATSICSTGRSTLGLDGPALKKFGIETSRELVTVNARVLRAPGIDYRVKRGSATVRKATDGGSWNLNNLYVAKPGAMISKWTFINVRVEPFHSDSNHADTVREFAKFMDDGMGIRINRTPVPHEHPTLEKGDRSIPEAWNEFFKWAQGEGIQFILFILSDADTAGTYANLKTKADCEFGIHSGCVVASKFAKRSLGFYANLGLKWNLKAGGVNHSLTQTPEVLKRGTTMIVGYDVTHPTNMKVTKGNEPPSLVGLVASIDSDMGQWPSRTWEQQAKKEMLGDELVEAFKSRLELWRKFSKTGNKLPEQIIIFRDGVSEAQYAHVVNQELPLIRRAISSLYSPKHTPKLSLIVSVKRHQTRFFPTDKNLMSKSGNITSGTVVDRGVTQVRYWDFFLTSHEAIKGTARPAHYIVLIDEIFRAHFKEDEAVNQLEKLTHDLCFLFGRATRSVSICPPAYYADIVCERARAHRPEYSDDFDETSSTAASSTGGASREVHRNLRDTMYYI